MKIDILFVVTLLVIGFVNAEDEDPMDIMHDVPEDMKPLQQTIFDRLVTPEDGEFQRDIKSLFSQYILVAAMHAANTSDDVNVAPASPPQVIPIPRRPLFAAPQQSQPPPVVAPVQSPLVPQPPQVIYVYVPEPTTQPPPVRNDNIKTKKPKPSKPPKTKKPKPPKPPKAPHPDFHPEPQQQQQPQQVIQPQSDLIQQQQYLLQQQQQKYLDQQKIIEAQLQKQQQQQYLQQQQQKYLQQQKIIEQQQQLITQQQQEPQSDVDVPATSPQISGTPKATATPILIPTGTFAPDTVNNSSTTLRPRPSNEHVLNQVDKILENVGRLNITGIVDQSLQINSSKPVQNLVTGILNTIFCTPINRWLGRCRG